ncbi:MAG: LamG-like jellyroll fold domain-containing protein [Lutibacter sp.]
MKKVILLSLIYLCTFNLFSKIIVLSENYEKSFSHKEIRTDRTAIGGNLTKAMAHFKTQITEEIFFDSDGDGIFDNVDIDDDNDGIKDTDEENFCRNSPISAKGIYCDTDNDGVPDILDLDSDNDGIPDVVEAGFGHLSEGRATLTGCSTWVDTNSNGMHDLTEEIIPLDSDGDGIPNYLDLDSDNDSIFDVDESGAGNINAILGYVNGDGDVNGDGVGDGLESETFRNKDDNNDGILEQFGDGILDIYDYGIGINQYGNMGQGLTGIGWKDYVKDTDNDGIPDYMDTKSNGTTFDIAGTLYANLDINNDGLIDGTVDIDRDGILDAFDTNTAIFGSPRDLNQKLHLYFDGRNDYVEELGVTIINGQPEVTLMAWIKLDPLFSNNGVIVGQNKFWIQINASKWFNANVNGYSLTAVDLPRLELGKWTHVAAVYDKNNPTETLKLYINGEKVATRYLNIQGGIETSTNHNFRIGRTPRNSTAGIEDMFKGEMDEVRVFNKALSEDKLQKMVYQELNDVNGFNSGAIIPRDISSTIGANLVRYYRMDVYKNDIIDNLTTPALDIGSGAKMYNFKNIYPQTAPLPYETKADGDWSNTTSWLHGNVWDIASEAKNKDWAIVHIKNNITTSNRHSTTGLIIDVTKKLSIKTSKELKNTWYLELDGAIDLEDESQLVQTSESMLDQDSGGFIERDQQGTANSFNYNYWSSSVGPISGTSARGIGLVSTNASHKLVDVLMDGTNANNPNEKGVINFQPAHWSADSGITSPIIISTYWLHTFNADNNNYSSWNPIDQNTALLPGEGYTMKGTSGAVAISNNQNYVFKGKPYNGDFTLPIAKNGKGNRLIGNPYPSAMDANKFIDDNIKDGGNNTIGNVFNGALYFWDHFGQKNSHYLKDYVGGYATYTKMGGAKAYSNDERINNNKTHGNKKPGRYIPVNQGFFVMASKDTLSNSIKDPIVIDGGDIVFKNSQRVFMLETTGTSVFMKGIQSKTARKEMDENKDDRDSRPKIWLQFDSPTGYHRQLLVGVDENASNHFDLGYDAPIADIGKEDMYWIVDGGEFVIQGVNNFDNDQELPLGLVIVKTGLVTIKIDETENLGKNVSLYIKDKLTGLTYEINSNPFSINLVAGKYLNRFALTFKTILIPDEDAALTIEDIVVTVKNPLMTEDSSLVQNEQLMNKGIYVFMNKNNAELEINNTTNTKILSVVLYNYLGQTIKIWRKNLNKTEISLPVNIITGVYVLHIKTANGQAIKKIIVE